MSVTRGHSQLFTLNFYKEAEVQTGREGEWIKEHLDKMGVLQSEGPDGIHPRVLYALSEAIAEPLVIILRTHRGERMSLKTREGQTQCIIF